MSDTGREQQMTEPSSSISHVTADQPISIAVIEAVASVSGRPSRPDKSMDEDDETNALDPLYEAIDPDALDAICQPRGDQAEAATTVTFTYCGHEVTVESTGQITVIQK